MPDEWVLPNFPKERRKAAYFIRNAKHDPSELIAHAWRDNWVIMGFRTLARRGIFVDWDGAGEVRSATNQWTMEWYRRYGHNRDFFSFPTDGTVSQERRDWVYGGPQPERVRWSEARYMHRTDTDHFRSAAQAMYDNNVRWIVHLGPFPRKTELLETAFAGDDLMVYRLKNPGITLPEPTAKQQVILPPTCSGRLATRSRCT